MVASQGGKGQSKTACKTCGKSHQGQCWFKDNQSAKAKGKGKSSKGGKGGKPQGGDAPKEKCQICGKMNHTAEKCYQRYKEKDAKTSKVQAATTSPGTGGTSQSGPGGSVAALSHREVDTSPETELRVQTTGVRSVTAKGQGLALVGPMSICAQPILPLGLRPRPWQELLVYGMLKVLKSAISVRPRPSA